MTLSSQPHLFVDLESVQLTYAQMAQLNRKYHLHIVYSKLFSATQEIDRFRGDHEIDVIKVESAVRDAADVGICIEIGRLLEQRCIATVFKYVSAPDPTIYVLSKDHFADILTLYGCQHVTGISQL